VEKRLICTDKFYMKHPCWCSKYIIYKYSQSRCKYIIPITTSTSRLFPSGSVSNALRSNPMPVPS